MAVPEKLIELRLENMVSLVITSGSFSNTPELNRLEISRVSHLIIETGAFTNINAASFTLKIEVI